MLCGKLPSFVARCVRVDVVVDFVIADYLTGLLMSLQAMATSDSPFSFVPSFYAVE